MDGGYATALLGFVVDIVMDQGGGVNQFKRQRQRHDIILLGPTCQFVGEQEENGTKPLAACIEDATRFESHFPRAEINLRLNQILKGLIDLVTHGFESRVKPLQIAAHNHPRTVGFLTGRPRP